MTTAWLKLGGRFGVTALALGGLLWLGGKVLHPGQEARVERSADEVTVMEERRGMRLDPEAPPRIAQEVDYSEGEAAAWWPKEEAPVLAGHVAAGRLPPVAERVGAEPIVMAGAEAGVVVAAGQEGKLACTQIPECPTPSAEYS